MNTLTSSSIFLSSSSEISSCPRVINVFFKSAIDIKPSPFISKSSNAWQSINGRVIHLLLSSLITYISNLSLFLAILITIIIKFYQVIIITCGCFAPWKHYQTWKYIRNTKQPTCILIITQSFIFCINKPVISIL